MASLSRTANGFYNITYRYPPGRAGKQFRRALGTTDPDEAHQSKALIERALKRLTDGEKELPPGATADDLWQFLRSGGKRTGLPSLTRRVSLSELGKEYVDECPLGSKEDQTHRTEAYHRAHFDRILGADTPIRALDARRVESYIIQRQKEKGLCGKTIQPDTICKELETLRQMWEFAKNRGYVWGENPVSAARKPMRDEKEPFKTYDEIQRIIERGGVDQSRIVELWGCLFLRETETLEVLKHVEAAGEAPFVLPLFSFAAFTGARRSEILRSRMEDFDFETGQVLIREKKRSRRRKLTFRQASLHERLRRIMLDWFQAHPGGSFTIATANGLPLTPSEANHVFRRAVRGSKWEVMKGYHVFRHSFASNLALKGTHQSVIDALMGHQTDEMRRRYRHLFPEETRSAIVHHRPS